MSPCRTCPKTSWPPSSVASALQRSRSRLSPGVGREGGMRIREARVEDAPAACDVLRRSIVELCAADHGNDPALLDPWLANKTPENVLAWMAETHLLVAEEQGRRLGAAGLSRAGAAE